MTHVLKYLVYSLLTFNRPTEGHHSGIPGGPLLGFTRPWILVGNFREFLNFR